MVCNGLALSVNENVLFVNDTIRQHIRAFDIRPDGTVDSASDRIFCELPGTEDGKPDGMKLDIAGNVYRSEEHTSERQSIMRTPYAVFCSKKKHTSLSELIHRLKQIYTH